MATCAWCSGKLTRDWTKYCDECVALMPRAKVSGPAEFAQRFPSLQLTAAQHALWLRENRQKYEPARQRARKKRVERRALAS